MKKIEKSNLVRFQTENKEHIKIQNKNNEDYHILFSDIELFKQMLETAHKTNISLNPINFDKYVVEDRIFMRVDFILESNEHHYLFDAFNVYYAVNSFGYYNLNKTLTKLWRKTVKNAYPNTSYSEAIKKLLNQELQEIVDKFNKDNVDLL